MIIGALLGVLSGLGIAAATLEVRDTFPFAGSFWYVQRFSHQHTVEFIEGPDYAFENTVLVNANAAYPNATSLTVETVSRAFGSVGDLPSGTQAVFTADFFASEQGGNQRSYLGFTCAAIDQTYIGSFNPNWSWSNFSSLDRSLTMRSDAAIADSNCTEFQSFALTDLHLVHAQD